MITEDDELALRRRRALYRATHRGTKEMDWLLGRFAQAVVGQMDDARLSALERLVVVPDTEIDQAVKGGAAFGQNDLDRLIADLRAFHGLAT